MTGEEGRRGGARECGWTGWRDGKDGGRDGKDGGRDGKDGGRDGKDGGRDGKDGGRDGKDGGSYFREWKEAGMKMAARATRPRAKG